MTSAPGERAPIWLPDLVDPIDPNIVSTHHTDAAERMKKPLFIRDDIPAAGAVDDIERELIRGTQIECLTRNDAKADSVVSVGPLRIPKRFPLVHRWHRDGEKVQAYSIVAHIPQLIPYAQVVLPPRIVSRIRVQGWPRNGPTTVRLVFTPGSSAAPRTCCCPLYSELDRAGDRGGPDPDAPAARDMVMARRPRGRTCLPSGRRLGLRYRGPYLPDEVLRLPPRAGCPGDLSRLSSPLVIRIGAGCEQACGVSVSLATFQPSSCRPHATRKATRSKGNFSLKLTSDPLGSRSGARCHGRHI
jgi:hypothetical protein